GVCVATHSANTSENSQPCTTTADIAGDCRAPGCEDGVCVATHIANTDENSQPCTTTPDVDGDCGNPGCEDGVCVATHIPANTETGCNTPPPCRITGGGVICTGADPANPGTSLCTTDPNTQASIERATFGGQVGAPYGLVGCHDDFNSIQGEW